MERYAYIVMLLDVREAKTVSQVSLGCLRIFYMAVLIRPCPNHGANIMAELERLSIANLFCLLQIFKNRLQNED